MNGMRVGAGENTLRKMHGANDFGVGVDELRVESDLRTHFRKGLCCTDSRVMGIVGVHLA